jgi:hypothetical protein
MDAVVARPEERYLRSDWRDSLTLQTGDPARSFTTIKQRSWSRAYLSQRMLLVRYCFLGAGRAHRLQLRMWLVSC